jgi:hypothetical protein
MKKIFFLTLCTVIFLNHILRAPIDPFENLFLLNIKDAYENEIKQTGVTDQTEISRVFKQRLGELIKDVKQRNDSKKYHAEHMNNFLTVAMALKHGVPDETFKDTKLARSLLSIVSETANSESLRSIADRSLLDYQLSDAYKIPLVRSKTI